MLLNAIKENVKLTLPILMTRLLGITSNLIAMMLMAKLGTDALSASALIMGIFSICVLLVMSFSFSLCALIAEASGSHEDNRVGKILASSLFLNTVFAIPFMLIFYHISTILMWLNQPYQVVYLVGLYFHGMIIGYLPMIWAGILEQFFIGIGKPKQIMYLSMINLFVMPLISSVLIFGKFGFPELGMFGAGLAVSIMSVMSIVYLLIIIVVHHWHKKYDLFTLHNKWDIGLIKRIYQLGWPIAFQFAGEFFAYMLITVMMGWLGVIALAAQQIILQFNTVIVMIPTSFSQATAVLVGRARGCCDEKLARYHVNIAIIMVCVLMAMIALLYLSIPRSLIHIYLDINDPKNTPISMLATILLSITALSQFFDGIRNVLAGAYRGMQETKIPMMISSVSLWIISIPLAYYLGFTLHQGAVGVRWGLTIGMMSGAGLLTLCWYADLKLSRLVRVKIFSS